MVGGKRHLLPEIFGKPAPVGAKIIALILRFSQNSIALQEVAYGLSIGTNLDDLEWPWTAQ